MAAKLSIGEKIKQIRNSKKIDSSELAFRSNIDKEQIDLIEKNKILPSLAPLIKIARSLGVHLSTFIDDIEHAGPVVTLVEEKNKSASFSNKNTKAQSHMDFFSMAGNKTGRRMEPFIVDINPERTNDYKLSSHEGEEFILVLEGNIEINYGKDTYILNTGDSIYYDSIVNHNVHAYQNQAAKILAVIYIPS